MSTTGILFLAVAVCAASTHAYSVNFETPSKIHENCPVILVPQLYPGDDNIKEAAFAEIQNTINLISSQYEVKLVPTFTEAFQLYLNNNRFNNTKSKISQVVSILNDNEHRDDDEHCMLGCDVMLIPSYPKYPNGQYERSNFGQYEITVYKLPSLRCVGLNRNKACDLTPVISFLTGEQMRSLKIMEVTRSQSQSPMFSMSDEKYLLSRGC